MEVGVDEGDSVAFLICYSKVDGIAVVMRWAAMVVDLGIGFLGVEELRSFGEILLGDHFGCRDFDGVRVGDIPACICEGNTEGFDQRVEILYGVVVFSL